MNPHLLPLALACGLTTGAIALLMQIAFEPHEGPKIAEALFAVLAVLVVLFGAATIGLVLTAAWQAAL